MFCKILDGTASDVSLVRLSLWDLVQLQIVDWPLEEGPVLEFTGKY